MQFVDRASQYAEGFKDYFSERRAKAEEGRRSKAFSADEAERAERLRMERETHMTRLLEAAQRLEERQANEARRAASYKQEDEIHDLQVDRYKRVAENDQLELDARRRVFGGDGGGPGGQAPLVVAPEFQQGAPRGLVPPAVGGTLEAFSRYGAALSPDDRRALAPFLRDEAARHTVASHAAALESDIDEYAGMPTADGELAEELPKQSAEKLRELVSRARSMGEHGDVAGAARLLDEAQKALRSTKSEHSQRASLSGQRMRVVERLREELIASEDGMDAEDVHAAETAIGDLERDSLASITPASIRSVRDDVYSLIRGDRAGGSRRGKGASPMDHAVEIWSRLDERRRTPESFQSVLEMVQRLDGGAPKPGAPAARRRSTPPAPSPSPAVDVPFGAGGPDGGLEPAATRAPADPTEAAVAVATEGVMSGQIPRDIDAIKAVLRANLDGASIDDPNGPGGATPADELYKERAELESGYVGRRQAERIEHINRKLGEKVAAKARARADEGVDAQFLTSAIDKMPSTEKQWRSDMRRLEDIDDGEGAMSQKARRLLDRLKALGDEKGWKRGGY